MDFSEFSADFHRKRLHQLFPPKKTLEDGEEFFDPPENVDEEAEKQSNVNIWNSRVLDKSNYDDALAREATGEVATFESVMDELNSLKGAISERVAEQSPLGKLLSSTRFVHVDRPIGSFTCHDNLFYVLQWGHSVGGAFKYE